MSRRAPQDLDAALESLARAEREARPAVSARLRARVLADAADVAAETAARHRAQAAPARRRRGWPGWTGGVDLWAGAALAAALVCLAVGLGVGYGAGEAVLAEVGFEDVRLAQAEEEEVAFLTEDAL